MFAIQIYNNLNLLRTCKVHSDHQSMQGRHSPAACFHHKRPGIRNLRRQETEHMDWTAQGLDPTYHLQKKLNRNSNSKRANHQTNS